MADEGPAERIARLFAGFAGGHGTHGEPRRDGLKWEIKTTAQTLRKPVTLRMWEQHLAGERPLGIIPIREDGTCVWGSGDIDEYDIVLTDVIEEVERRKFPLIPCRSKSGGLHLFLFARRPVPAALMQSALRAMMAAIGHSRCEIFPKQTRVLADRGDLGSWMVMPYFGGTFGDKLRWQHGLKRSGSEMTLAEFLAVAEKSAVTEEQLGDLSELAAREERESRRGNGDARPRGPFSDGPPCLEFLSRRGFPEGGRNKALFHLGVYYKKSDPANWQELLERANHEFMRPPLPSDEVGGVVRSLGKKEYEYLCKDEPMCSHCDSIKCRGRKYGVGGGANFPEIRGLRKMRSDPPTWFVEVEGQTIECSTEDLQEYRRFHRLCMERLNQCYAPLSQKVWFSMIGGAMGNVDEFAAPGDVGTSVRVREMLEEWCTNRSCGEEPQDLHTGRPILLGEQYQFRLRDFEQFLERERVRDVRQGKILNVIKELGGGEGFHNMQAQKKPSVRYRWVPRSSLHPVPEVSTPRAREEDVV